MTLPSGLHHSSALATPAREIELVMAVLWFLVTFTVFPHDELILYPLALYFTYALYRDRRATIPILADCWPLLLLPAWAILTSPLAVIPQTAFRSGVQMAMTMLISVLFVAWMSPRRIVLTAFFATGLCGVLSLFITSYHSGAMTGIFAHKNMLGAKMLLLWAAALCIAFDPWIRIWLRAVALGFAALALFLILASQSATALVLASVTIALVGGFAFFAGGGQRTPADRLAGAFITLGVLAFLIPLLPVGQVSLLDYLLENLGKSRTLTGRTELWAYAEDVIRQRPLIGHGSGGFWRYQENDLVRQIFAEFHKSPNQVFSFHSSFYEIAVHFGLIGLVFAIVTIVWAGVRLVGQLVQRGGLPFIFFLTIASIELIRAFVESELMRPFVLAHMLIWMGSCFLSKHRSMHGDRRKRRHPYETGAGAGAGV
ncbi:O-antigen ligase family protein [Marivita sp. GX14005]|uniref:O-antigen ligase family protein n=1 Tax=Marivita sp. GX14005 TaxID=2942276 RepID=UPI002018CC91|nr:O-antigen ligase family protein [Marivita sp. GX14005]MCL3881741.1 O-antigen ligase family protein [Marivita sp. GX14005]